MNRLIYSMKYIITLCACCIFTLAIMIDCSYDVVNVDWSWSSSFNNNDSDSNYYLNNKYTGLYSVFDNKKDFILFNNVINVTFRDA